MPTRANNITLNLNTSYIIEKECMQLIIDKGNCKLICQYPNPNSQLVFCYACQHLSVKNCEINFSLYQSQPCSVKKLCSISNTV